MDLLTSDTKRAREFYAGLFGWTAGEAAEQFGGYFMFMNEGVPVAGCMQKVPGMPGGDGPDQWGVYLSVADAKAISEKALAHGGKLREGPMDIADLGTEAILEDVTGARIGLWEAKTFRGGTVFDTPGTPAYFELITREYASAVEFYRDVFGWDPRVVSDTPEFRLTALKDGDETIAGIMDGSSFLPASQPDRWGIYIKVTDTDAALATITRLGGTVTEPAMDTPYGRIAGAADPTGAAFKIVG
jgi:predicted enzyme related to lactoylglutathione lyase